LNPVESTCAAIANKLASLPPFAPSVARLLGISLDDVSALAAFEEVFKSDPALTAELLKMANSAAFGVRTRVQSIGVAIRYLGPERVRSMAATSALRSQTQRGQRHPYLASLWAHGIATAAAAEALGAAHDCLGLYTLGLTHDLGRLGLFLVGGNLYATELSQEFQDIEHACEVERGLVGMTHCQAGALVATAWGFPEGLAASMGEHHTAFVEGSHHPQDLIAIACRMADSLGFPEVPLLEPPGWPELGFSTESFPQLEPEALWDQITRRIADLSH